MAARSSSKLKSVPFFGLVSVMVPSVLMMHALYFLILFIVILVSRIIREAIVSGGQRHCFHSIFPVVLLILFIGVIPARPPPSAGSNAWFARHPRGSCSRQCCECRTGLGAACFRLG